MGISSDLMNAPREFLTLFKAGQEAARQGDHQHAHDLFRQAIEVDPYHEQVWLWLASVVETDEDRRVCFENVLELNPANTTAHRQLQRLDQKAQSEAAPPETERSRRVGLGRWLFRLILIVLVSFAIATALIVTGVA